MSVVVTGAAGFIGRAVVATLRARGHRVVGIDRRGWTPAAGETALRAELTSADDLLRELLPAAEAVIHLAGCPGVRDRAGDVAFRRVRDNVIAGERVIAATPLDTPLVVASSSSVYGGSRAGRASSEDDPLLPRGGYARSKVALEERCAQRADRGGTVAVVRPFTVAGEGQRPDMAIAGWIDAARSGRPLRVLGSLDRLRDVTDVRDVAEGVVRAAERHVTAVVNLGTGRPVALADMVAGVAAATGARPVVEVEPAASEEVAATRADTRRCAALLGFVPHTDLSTLIGRQLAALHPPVPHLLETAV